MPSCLSFANPFHSLWIDLKLLIYLESLLTILSIGQLSVQCKRIRLRRLLIAWTVCLSVYLSVCLYVLYWWLAKWNPKGLLPLPLPRDTVGSWLETRWTLMDTTLRSIDHFGKHFTLEHGHWLHSNKRSIDFFFSPFQKIPLPV